ncbi:normocyte-binding protein [Clostridium beijerinckii]|uniref:normocyte-binding protein n=1 Tax=Clostridium beijerinckii TaxID=1520 RepID=UPI00098C3C67|nr:normocyte-binding protein [Clostridium beijerinckii]NRT79247.1 uncharacterized protein (UPF0297 family) [Clostridium beijerinckii]OOM46158.1 hypothetical protein CBEIJ_31920 [Clostridium beijerinckii]
MENRIYEKLSEIKDLNDRIMLKKIMNSVFEELEEHSNNRINGLEKRVFNELHYIKEKYNIYSTIVKRDRLDITDEFLFPMLLEDTEEKVYDTKEILKVLEAKESKKLFKVFLKCDYLIFKEFISRNSNIKGVIKTDKKTYEAHFKVQENHEYKRKIERLYKSFINSNIAWTTINNPYIHKIADLFLIGCEDKIQEDEEIIEIEVDFGDYSKFIKYNMVPLWNVKELSIKCSGFPMPCIDKVGYEHDISIEKEGKDNGYLIDSKNPDINWAMFTKESVIISSNIKDSIEWNLWSIINPDKNDPKKYEYELMTNQVSINFSNKLAFDKSYTIKTKTELARLINSFKASKYLKFHDISLMESSKEEQKHTYEVNDFIIDEIREDNIKKSLILYFEPADKENYLNKDILSFLVSEVQFIYPEYKCEGRLI